MHRFYCPNTDFSPQKITLNDSAEIHHLKNVLRMKKGDRMEIFNGRGDEVLCVIEKMTEDSAEVSVLERRRDAKGRIRVILACAIPKKAKFEFIIEKATELGVDEIIPMQTARTEFVVKEEGRLERKNARYQTVAVNAAKRSGRSVIPEVAPVRSFKDVIAGVRGETVKLIPCLMGERKNLRDALSGASKDIKNILFLIGPEGDFTPQEVDAALKAGFIPVSLGETVLKVDTAAIAVIACARLLLH